MTTPSVATSTGRRARRVEGPRWALLLGALSCCGLALAPRAAAQDAEPDAHDEPSERDGDEAPPPSGARPALPAPSLEDPEPLPTEPSAPEPEAEPEILMHIGLGDHPDWESSEPLPPDVPFQVPSEVPSDRTADLTARQNAARLPGATPEQALPTYTIAVGAGFSRLLGIVPFDFLRLDQRFEARVPGFEALRLGVGLVENIGEQGVLFEGGPRIGMGAFFCADAVVTCEGSITIQPGVALGVLTNFDLHASVDLRFVLFRLVELTVVGGYSLIGENSMVSAAGQAGIAF